MLTDSRKIAYRLKSEGWVVVRIKGSHHVFRHPNTGTVVVLPHPHKDLPAGTVRSIYKSAGWAIDRT